MNIQKNYKNKPYFIDDNEHLYEFFYKIYIENLENNVFLYEVQDNSLYLKNIILFFEDMLYYYECEEEYLKCKKILECINKIKKLNNLI